eukprot:m51a1_g9764 hypothetical protein (548) ;mRNA; r:1632168-1639215
MGAETASAICVMNCFALELCIVFNYRDLRFERCQRACTELVLHYRYQATSLSGVVQQTEDQWVHQRCQMRASDLCAYIVMIDQCIAAQPSHSDQVLPVQLSMEEFQWSLLPLEAEKLSSLQFPLSACVPALVNQMVIYVQSFVRRMQRPAVWGVKTTKMCLREHDCDLLICTADVLLTKLNTPCNAGWLERVRYIVFDEFHFASTNELGRTYTQIMVLAECPFIALSATIANAPEIAAWLSGLGPRRVATIPQAGVRIPRFVQRSAICKMEEDLTGRQALLLYEALADVLQADGKAKLDPCRSHTLAGGLTRGKLSAYIAELRDYLLRLKPSEREMALQLGVGFYSADRPLEYLRLVEAMFRERALGAVFATTELANISEVRWAVVKPLAPTMFAEAVTPHIVASSHLRGAGTAPVIPLVQQLRWRFFSEMLAALRALVPTGEPSLLAGLVLRFPELEARTLALCYVIFWKRDYSAVLQAQYNDRVAWSVLSRTYSVLKKIRTAVVQDPRNVGGIFSVRGETINFIADLFAAKWEAVQQMEKRGSVL